MMTNSEFEDVKAGPALPSVPPALPRPSAPPTWADLTRPVGDTFLRLAERHGAQLLFCISAVCVLYGMLRILGPLLLLDGSLGRKLPAFGALNVYELSLFLVLSLIVLWRRRLSEAPLLVALTSVFAGAIGLTLDTLAIDGLATGLALGSACLALGLLKVGYLRRVIRVPFDAWLLAAAAALLGGLFLAGGMMTRTLARQPCDAEALAATWRYALLSSLLAGGLLWVRAVHVPASPRPAQLPLIHRPAMAWAAAVILLAGAVIHAYSLGYIFDVSTSFADVLPFAAVGALLAVEAFRLRGSDRGPLPAMALSIPLALTAWAGLTRQFTGVPLAQFGFFWHPPTLMLASAGWGLWIARRRRCGQLLAVSVAGILLSVLIAGIEPSATPRSPGELNWTPFCLLTCGALLAAGALRRSIGLSMLGAVALSFMVSLSGHMSGPLAAAALTGPAGVTALMGAAMAAVALAFGRKTPAPLVLFAALLLAMGVWWQDSPPMALAHAAGCAFAFALGLAFWYRCGTKAALAILLLPAARLSFSASRVAGGWTYVVLGFVLLAAGAGLALCRGGVKRGDVPGESRTESQEG